MTDAKWATIKEQFDAYEDRIDREQTEPDYFPDKARQVEYSWWVYDRFLRPQGQHIRKGRTRYPE